MMASSRCCLFILLFICFSVVMEGSDYLKYKDPKQPLNVCINDLLSRMTLSEKIGQMSQIARENASSDVIKNYFIGSVLSGGGSVPAPKASVETWMNMTNEMQKAALSTRLGIPMIYGIDAVHDHNTAYNATIFPHNVGLGATRGMICGTVGILSISEPVGRCTLLHDGGSLVVKQSSGLSA